MTVPGCALQLLKALNIDGQQLIPLLQPFNYSLPQTEEEFVRLQDTIRRIGHVMENTPNNIGQALRHGNQPARQGEYFAGGSDQPAQTFLNMGDAPLANSSPLPNPSSPHPGYPDYSEASLAATWQVNPSWQTGSNVWQGTALPLHQQQAYSSPTSHVFWANDGEAYDEVVEEAWESSTDTDTSSDSGKEEVDMSEFEHLDNIAASQKAFLGYRTAKRKWRRVTQKPVRKVRRFIRKTFKPPFQRKFFRSHNTKGSGKGKGKTRWPSFHTREEMATFLSGKGKGHRAHTSGKGNGRKGNPKDRDGNVMKCHGCQSDQHLVHACPNNPNGKGKGRSDTLAPTFHASQPIDYGRGIGQGLPAISVSSSYHVQENNQGGPLDALLSAIMPQRVQTSSFPVNEFMPPQVPVPTDLLQGNADPWLAVNLPVPRTTVTPQEQGNLWSSWAPSPPAGSSPGAGSSSHQGGWNIERAIGTRPHGAAQASIDMEVDQGLPNPNAASVSGIASNAVPTWAQEMTASGPPPSGLSQAQIAQLLNASLTQEQVNELLVRGPEVTHRMLTQAMALPEIDHLNANGEALAGGQAPRAGSVFGIPLTGSLPPPRRQPGHQRLPDFSLWSETQNTPTPLLEQVDPSSLPPIAAQPTLVNHFVPKATSPVTPFMTQVQPSMPKAGSSAPGNAIDQDINFINQLNNSRASTITRIAGQPHAKATQPGRIFSRPSFNGPSFNGYRRPTEAIPETSNNESPDRSTSHSPAAGQVPQVSEQARLHGIMMNTLNAAQAPGPGFPIPNPTIPQATPRYVVDTLHPAFLSLRARQDHESDGSSSDDDFHSVVPPVPEQGVVPPTVTGSEWGQSLHQATVSSVAGWDSHCRKRPKQRHKHTNISRSQGLLRTKGLHFKHYSH